MTERLKKIIFTVIIIILILLNFYMLAFGVVILINIYYLYFYYKKSMFYYKTPYYNKALTGMYVKFLGIVQNKNHLKTPIDGRVCEYYKFKLKALWYVKAPRPSKGMIQESKPLGMGYSKETFKISDSNRIILIDPQIPDDKIGKYKINKQVIDFRTPIKGYPSADKYETYRYINNYLQEGDLVTIYGRLIKRRDGCFVITNTKHPRMPFVVYLGDLLKFGSFYKYEFTDKIITIITLGVVFLGLFLGFFLGEVINNVLLVLSVWGIISPFKKIFIK